MFKDKKDFNSLKIADFGFSTVSENDFEEGNCGTLIYKAPEQISGKFYDYYIDVWAAGFILYILCSGGAHPIYRVGMTYDEYVEKFNKLKDWTFPVNFPMYLNKI
jgi:serine/threonine protein kinase